MRQAEINQIATTYLPKIARIARGMARSLPAHIDAEDLQHAGVVGLMTALKSYDPKLGDQVDVYVTRRIRGAILDELRALDPLSRDVRRDAKSLRAAERVLENELGRPPDEAELARRAGVAVERVREVRRAATAAATTALHDLTVEMADAASDDPIERIASSEERARLTAAIQALPPRDQTVLSLYYVEELSLKEIGHILGVTESRVCQILGAATRKLRAALSDA
jgi:RNA polymerase sigma factor for flagellar operon FliA